MPKLKKQASDSPNGSPWYVVKESSIHGRGLFARKAIPSGTRVGTMTGRPTQRDGRHVLWVYEDDGSCAGLRVQNDLRFANHSQRPNTELDGFDLFALRRIRKGEEITFHYGDDWEQVE
ncbi:MAG: SET domain-containing protein [Planctomycetota bacterium]|nr:MAG: SET domain-containing protein [Planctomycetota bacterium]